jgi:hypothetical protein
VVINNCLQIIQTNKFPNKQDKHFLFIKF